MLIIRSVNGVPIRLTEERWQHIVSRHPEMKGQKAKVLETINAPDYIQRGDFGTKMAVKFYKGTPLTDKFLIVVYKETDRSDGFVVTAYFATKPAKWREVLWKR
ncbi:MAG: hypothetical protein J7J22_04080 [Candidatus Verstraetearchaeota archaeon]|nr:hypothetical protein [Candidatus Verstraetearchaeota archaeon]